MKNAARPPVTKHFSRTSVKNKNSNPLKSLLTEFRAAVRGLKLRKSLSYDLHSIYEFYLTPKEREKLAAMGKLQKWVYRVIWFAVSILSKLSIFRRLLLLLSLYLLLFDMQNLTKLIAGYAVLFLILLLELKDKLLAHDELQAGRAIQEALRPQHCPVVEGWDVFLSSQSANQVGGDLLDCLKIDEQHTGFMVGDVSGKGLPAALLMAQLQASVQALVSHIPSMSQLATQLNALYCRNDLKNNFISFIFLKTTSKSGLVDYVNAGHLPPVLIHGGKANELQKGGLALGLSPRQSYKKESVTLTKGDALLIYTDGVTEARNEQGKFYGEERLFRLLESLGQGSASFIGQSIISDLKAFSGDAGRSDDMTIMIIKRTEE